MDKEMISYVQKAAMFDALVNYIKTVEYIDKKDILAFVGESCKKEDAAND